jgi:hypothetical protein
MSDRKPDDDDNHIETPKPNSVEFVVEPRLPGTIVVKLIGRWQFDDLVHQLSTVNVNDYTNVIVDLTQEIAPPGNALSASRRQDFMALFKKRVVVMGGGFLSRSLVDVMRRIGRLKPGLLVQTVEEAIEVLSKEA